MDPSVLAFAQIMAIIVPTVVVLTGAGVLAHWIVERTNRLPHRTAARTDDARLQRVEQAVDTIALEVERLGEGQRFVTKLLLERSTEGQPPRDPPPQRGRVITPH